MYLLKRAPVNSPSPCDAPISIGIKPMQISRIASSQW